MKTKVRPESDLMYILRLALTLLAITTVVAALLAGVNAITKDRIAAAKAEKTQKAIGQVLSGAAEVEEIPFTDDTGLVTRVYRPVPDAGGDASPAAGYAVEVVPAGFGGEITMMVGVSADGKILGISIISHSETPSLGAVTAAESSAGQTFRDQFVGLSGTLAVSKDGGGVDAITGATVTSRAVTRGVNAALECVANLG